MCLRTGLYFGMLWILSYISIFCFFCLLRNTQDMQIVMFWRNVILQIFINGVFTNIDNETTKLYNTMWNVSHKWSKIFVCKNIAKIV